MCDEIRLVRHDLGETPWGFRITGGRDFGTPLLVVKVVGGSIAALAGVQVGDLVRGINYVPTNEFTHLDAQRAILESGDTLILNLLKGGEYEQYYQPEPPAPVPQVPVIDVQSPEDKEVEEIGQDVSENLDLAFVVRLDRSGRISAVEEVSTPSTTPRTTPTSRRPSSSRRKSSASSSRSGKTPTSEENEKKRKISVTANDNGSINIQPPSYEDATRNKSVEKKENSIEQEVTLHEEMRMETSLKKTTTEIKERTEEEFIMGVRDDIFSRARKENRELTEEEIAEMMAGEAEVIEARKGKEVIGVNFQKFMPKCEFIKDSEVFKVLQEEQTKKEKSEEEQLEKDPLKRFSKFLIKPKTTKPIPKPKPIHPEPMPWQLRLNSPSVPADTKTATNTESVSTDKTNEVRNQSLETGEENKEIFCTEELESNKETKNITVSSVNEKEDHLRIKIQKSEKQEYNEVIRREEEETEEVENYIEEKELEMIDWKETKKEKRKESDDVSSHKSSSSDEGRRSKSKKVGFVGLQCKEDIEKQLAEIQKELLTLQRLPIEIQNHLLIVQQSLQDILAQRSQIQTPENGEEKIEATEVYIYNAEGDDEGGEIAVKDDKDGESSEEISIKKHESLHEEISASKEVTTRVEESSMESESLQHESSSSSNNEINVEGSDEVKETEVITKEEEEKDEGEKKKDLPHGQEDVEICESKVKPALPLTPQLRPMVLPGGRKWVQPKDAYTDEYIAETLVSQSEVLVGTTIGVNFRKYIPPKFDTANSAVYRLIHDIEEKTKKGVAERPEKVHGLEEYYHPPIDKRHFYAAELAVKKHVDNLFQEAYGPVHH